MLFTSDQHAPPLGCKTHILHIVSSGLLDVSIFMLGNIIGIYSICKGQMVSFCFTCLGDINQSSYSPLCDLFVSSTMSQQHQELNSQLPICINQCINPFGYIPLGETNVEIPKTLNLMSVFRCWDCMRIQIQVLEF